MDFEQIAREYCRGVRGARSQVAWSRRLGYRSNVAYSWEKGRRWPTAAEAFRAAERNGTDLDGALRHFFGRACPAWIDTLNLSTAAAVAALLDEVRGTATISSLATKTGISRYAISRWLSGATEPKLPDFFRLFEAKLHTARRPAHRPGLGCPYANGCREGPLGRATTRRRAEKPWTQGILRAIELDSYRSMPAHQPGWIAGRLGISMAEEADCLAFLLETDQVAWTGTHYEGRTVAVDTRGRPEIGQSLKVHWAQEGVRRIAGGAPGQFSYVVFSVSDSDFERIRELHLRYFNTLRGIIAASEPNERVAVVNVQLFGLEEYDEA